MAKRVIKVRKMEKKSSFVRFLVIVFSFISLISRIIYSTYATWLTITTFDCIPCENSTGISNASTDLFIAHHSSAVFKTIRGLNINGKSDSVVKRSIDFNDSIGFINSIQNNSQFIRTDGHKNFSEELFSNQTIEILDIGSDAGENRTNSVVNNTVVVKRPIKLKIKKRFSNHSNSNTLNGISARNEAKQVVTSFFDEKTEDSMNSVETNPENGEYFLDSVDSPAVDNETTFEKFTYIPSEDLIDLSEQIVNGSNELKDLSDEWPISSFNESLIDGDNTMTIILNETESNSTKLDSKQLNEDQLIANNSDGNTIHMTSNFNVCSEDCRQFLSIELNDPNVRKWASIVITGVLYLYAFVMFGIFMGSCLSIVDLLVISTFIEGAKLFAGFILIIIDSFNGKEIHLNLIDVKFNVNSGGNGWTADFSYSEYLLDIIIFFLSAFLCIKVYKCLDKTPKKVPSIEELMDTRGTYRSNPSRNSLEPIFENN